MVSQPAYVPEALMAPCIRLLAEVAITPGGVVAKKRQLMTGLCEQFQCCMWFWGLFRSSTTSSEPFIFNVLDGGVTDDTRDSFIQAYTDAENVDPTYTAMQKLPGFPHLLLTTDRSRMVSDEEWYSSGHYQIYRKPHGIDHMASVFYPVADGVTSSLGMHRKIGKPAFTNEELQVLHLIFNQIEWLHQEDVPVDYGKELLKLTQRERQCFMYLCMGLARKQVADRMSISAHTANDYVKAVYQKYEVSSQAELIQKVYTGVLV